MGGGEAYIFFLLSFFFQVFPYLFNQPTTNQNKKHQNKPNNAGRPAYHGLSPQKLSTGDIDAGAVSMIYFN